jgi:very-short-patch-repair endonuclease
MTVDTDADAALARHVAEHHGVFRGAHARMAGLTERQIERRIVDRRWLRLYRDVYRLHGAPSTWEGDVLAACWAGGFRAVASHRSAAELHGMPGRTRELVELVSPRWRRTHEDSIVVHETKRLDPIDATVVDGIAVTTPVRTLFDLCSVYRAGMVEIVFENGLRRGLFTEHEIAATVKRLSRSGRAGGPVLRRLLGQRDPARRPTESEMETVLLQVLRAAGLPAPIVQHEIWVVGELVARVDAAYPAERIAIEYDSDEFHSGRSASRRDRSRRHRLLASGWVTVDVGPAELRNGAAQTCSAIAEALRARRRAA